MFLRNVHLQILEIRAKNGREMKIHLVGTSVVVYLHLHIHHVSGAHKERGILGLFIHNIFAINYHLLFVSSGSSTNIPGLKLKSGRAFKVIRN